MKLHLMFVALSWAFITPVIAQTLESKQTPDVVDDALPTQTPQSEGAYAPLSQLDIALIQSAFDGKLEEVEILVAKGAAVNLQDKKKRTPLIMAASNGHTAVVEFLVSKGAEVDAKDGDGQTALMYASKRSFNETVAILLKNGAEVNFQSKKRRLTALMLAAGWNNVELVQMLLEHGADAHLTDNFGNTARSWAEKRGNTAVIELLPDPAAQEGTQ